MVRTATGSRVTTNRLVMRSWQEAAANLGLSYAVGPAGSHNGMMLTGHVQGFAATISEHFYSHSEHVLHNGTTTDFRIELDLPHLGTAFALWPAGRRRRLGSPSPDTAGRDCFVTHGLMVDGLEEDVARRFFTVERCRAIRAADVRGFTWMIDGRDLVHRRRRLVIDQARIKAYLDRLVAIARAITETTPAMAPGAPLPRWPGSGPGATRSMVPVKTRRRSRHRNL